jgi:heterotetrameric sarcosine oxidase gamma subunit
MKALEILLEEVRCHELIMPTSRLRAAPSSGAQPPGSVRRYADGAALLHMGPGRWLLVGHAQEREAALVVTAEASGGSLLDVSGKWLRLSVTGAEAERHLARFLNVTQVLHERDCAPVTILDCPTLLVRGERGFELWTTRSWARWLRESLAVTPGQVPSAAGRESSPGDGRDLLSGAR